MRLKNATFSASLASQINSGLVRIASSRIRRDRRVDADAEAAWSAESWFDTLTMSGESRAHHERE